MVFNKYILTFILILPIRMILAQDCNYSLKGVVRDEDNSEPLGFAVVKIINPEKVLQTDDHGEFEIKGLCAGKYELLVQHVGCKDSVFTIELTKSKKVVLRLPHHLNALTDVEVVTKHVDAKSTQVVNDLEAKDLDKSRGQSLADQLKQVNGVTTFNTGPTVSKPVINGMQGYRILILNNGVRQEGQQWGNEHAPEIDPFVAQKLTVLRGASAVRYGSDAIGGVVLVQPADMPDTAAVTGEFNIVGALNGRSGAMALQAQGYFDKIKYFSWRIQGSVKRAGNVKTPDYYLKNTGAEENNFSYTLDYHRQKFGVSLYYSQFNSKVGIFSGAHTGNLTDLQAAFNRTRPQDSLAGFSYVIGRPYQNIEHELIKASADLHTGPRSRIYLNYANQFNIRQEFDKHLPKNAQRAALDKPAADYRMTTHTSEVYWEHDYIRSFRGKFGVQGMYQENVYREQFFIPNYLNKTFGVFAMERFIRPKYELEAGARFDYKFLKAFYYNEGELQQPVREFKNPGVSLGAILKPKNHTHINLHIANGWRAPAVNELYSNGLHHGVGAVERGRADLKTEFCVNAVGSVVYHHERLYAGFTGFYYWFDNFIYYSPAEDAELTLRGAFPVFNYTQSDARISGADALIKYHMNKYINLKARSMWVRGLNLETKQHLIYMPSDRYEGGVTFSLPDSKSLSETYIEPVVLYVAKQTRVPALLDFAPAPDAYFLLGMNLSSTMKMGRQKLIITFSITNATNEIYRDYLDRFRYYNDAIGANYTLRLRIPFTAYDKK